MLAAKRSLTCSTVRLTQQDQFISPGQLSPWSVLRKSSRKDPKWPGSYLFPLFQEGDLWESMISNILSIFVHILVAQHVWTLFSHLSLKIVSWLGLILNFWTVSGIKHIFIFAGHCPLPHDVSMPAMCLFLLWRCGNCFVLLLMFSRCLCFGGYIFQKSCAVFITC